MDEDFLPSDTLLGTQQLSAIDNDIEFSEERCHTDGRNNMDDLLKLRPPVEKLHQVRATALSPKRNAR